MKAELKKIILSELYCTCHPDERYDKCVEAIISSLEDTTVPLPEELETYNVRDCDLINKINNIIRYLRSREKYERKAHRRLYA